MRPHKLTISGFLSYGGCEVIDFDALASAGGLFLIQGTTGAGKTSILDAISFALYNQLPGSRNANSSTYRSDFATVDTPTFVELEVTLRGERYMIYRSPKYEVPKKRGEGFTDKPAEIKIKKLVNGQWEPFSTAKQESGTELSELVGLDASQFFKLILLPQGDFAKFLHSKSKEREAILENLFSDEIEKFKKLTDYFWDTYNGLKKEDEDSARDVLGEIQNINQTFSAIYSGKERDLSLSIPNSADLTKAYLLELVKVIDTDATLLSAAEVAKNEAIENEKDANTHFENSETVKKAKERLSKAERELKKWREDNKDHVPLKVVDNQVVGEISQTIEKLNGEKGEKEAFNQKVETLLKLRKDVVEAESKQSAAEISLAAYEDDVKADEDEIKELEGILTSDFNPAEERAKNSLELKVLNDQITLAGNWEKSEKTLTTFKSELAELVQIRDAAIAEYDRLQQNFEAAQASVFAEKLEEGSPCPVCGSTEHPLPAKKTGAATKEDVRKALKASQDAAEKVAGKEGEISGQEAKVNELKDGKDLDVEELRNAISQLNAKDEELDTEITRLTQVRERLQELKSGQEKNATKREELKSEVVRSNEALSSAKKLVTSAEKEIKIEAGADISALDLAPFESKINNLRSLIQEFEPLLSEYTLAEGANEALEASSRDDIPDVKEAKLAREAAEENLKAISQRMGRLKSLDDELKKIEGKLREAEIKQATVKDDLERYEHVAKYLKGVAGDKITLVSYFLGQRLFQILDAANKRMQTMTRGQFSLHTNHEKKGGGQNYLSISVHDAWNQGMRDATALSGGETFTASLALAFGLADVVTSEAKVQQLDSLFIDEGFGSLDPDYLQAVMQSLEELRESGRLIGLISHVEEMKQRISMQLLVSKDGKIGTKVKIIENVGG